MRLAQHVDVHRVRHDPVAHEGSLRRVYRNAGYRGDPSEPTRCPGRRRPQCHRPAHHRLSIGPGYADAASCRASRYADQGTAAPGGARPALDTRGRRPRPPRRGHRTPARRRHLHDHGNRRRHRRRPGLRQGHRSPGSGPVAHAHGNEDEAFYLLDGELEFLIGARTFTVGDFVFVPRHTLHRFTNVGDKDAAFLFMYTPGGHEQFFLDNGDERVEGQTSPPWAPERYAALVDGLPAQDVTILPED
ncbi:cupin domain-containing protein [Streptomyces sp. CB00072]|uniref:cupin domain-containing protein n=1 Tax=Streptomyces sp. CB00072 TaxID=1703928 RepID=UPI001301345E|nr:cupin domain-containing protein [Streptomyces sp. CB00072]